MGLKNTGNSSWRSPPAVAATSNSNTGSDSTANSKPTVAKKGHTTSKTIIKFHSKSCVDTAQQETAFHKFDVTVPQQAHKMQQRQKAIAKGKNTVGYDEYIRQVPKQKRKKFSMETPATPDASLDIPNKKWNGMVKAWRIALHKYDPVALQQSFAEAQATEESTPSSTTASKPLSVKERELEHAKSRGLLDLVQVEEDPAAAAAAAAILPMDTCLVLEGETKEMSMLDEWERARGDNHDGDGCASVMLSDGDESDDDLL